LDKCGVIAATLAAVANNPNSLMVAKAAVEVLSGFSKFAETSPSVFSNNAIPVLLSILEKFGSDPEVAQAVMTCFARLASTPDNLAKLVAAGVLQQVVATLNKHNEKPDVVKACLALLEQAANVAKNIDVLPSCGAVAAILQAMEKNKTDKTIQEVGQRTLAIIQGASQIKDAVDGLNGALAAAQAANFSVATMEKLLAAARLIGNLANNAQNIDALIKSGAVTALINSLLAVCKLPNSELKSQILLAQAQALLKLAKANPAVASQLITSGALSALLKAAIADPENEELAEAAMELVALCASDAKNLAEMIKQGMIEDIVALMKLFPFNEKIQAAGLKALAAMCAVSEDAARRLLAAGGAEFILDCLRNNMEDPNAVLACLDIINAMAVDEEAAKKLLAAGAIDLLLAVIRKYPNHVEVLTGAMQALASLMISEKAAMEVGEKGGIPLFIAAMRTHYAQEPLVQIDTVLCDSLASVVDNAKKFLQKELATIELVKWILSSYPANAAIKEAAERLLATLMALIKKEEDERKRAQEAKEAALNFAVFDEAAADELIRLLGTETDANMLKKMCKNVVVLSEEEKNAQLLIAKGGLQALAKLVKKNKGNEDLFYPASEAFIALAQAVGDNLFLLKEGVCFEALSELLAPHSSFADGLDPDLLL